MTSYLFSLLFADKQKNRKLKEANFNLTSRGDQKPEWGRSLLR